MESRPAFSFASLRAIVGGHSAIDLPHLQVESEADATAFLAGYGFDLDSIRQRAELEDLRAGAVSFIERVLLTGSSRIDPRVRDEADVRKLLQWASQTREETLRAWSCAILRVGHTLAHAQSYLNARYGQQIREQVAARFAPHVHHTVDGWRLGQGREAIPLVHFESRASKSLDSVTIKLLHAVDNVASDVFDWLGFRFVARERYDALLVVRYLRRNSVIMFANIKPSRSRNTLVDLDWLEAEIKRRGAQELDAPEHLEALRAALRERECPGGDGPRSHNQYSSTSYHSIQFTAREMIRVADYESAEPSGCAPWFFFPYEVQVLDEASYRESREGFASHEQYRARQLDTVRRRVLGHLLDDAVA